MNNIQKDHLLQLCCKKVLLLNPRIVGVKSLSQHDCRNLHAKIWSSLLAVPLNGSYLGRTALKKTWHWILY